MCSVRVGFIHSLCFPQSFTGSFQFLFPLISLTLTLRWSNGVDLHLPVSEVFHHWHAFPWMFSLCIRAPLLPRKNEHSSSSGLWSPSLALSCPGHALVFLKQSLSFTLRFAVIFICCSWKAAWLGFGSLPKHHWGATLFFFFLHLNKDLLFSSQDKNRKLGKHTTFYSPHLICSWS